MPTEFQCELISWARIVDLVTKLAVQIRHQGFQPDIIIAIGRGGYVPARLLADYLDVMDLTDIKIVHYHAADKLPLTTVKFGLSADVSNRKVLVIDDVSDSGDTFTVAIEHILQRSTPTCICTAVLHHKTTSRFVPDFYAAKLAKWRWLIYPWARVEDISSFVAKLAPCPDNRQDVAAYLKQAYGIQVPDKLLNYVLQQQAEDNREKSATG
ncbi:phosphoribosyltransferase [Methylophaga sp. OBS4]|uniref:phosphoribosyltransferase n=1 Tax=Methylophaga sp. OBS4 TaxID=2991935 RepID=UPI002251701E|nr:phosphoribosyltransferase [Methylophaga sp. OBS4]MCX4187512.1 phosphoribosyltransferase [Methylophaga sp. OBS4]